MGADEHDKGYSGRESYKFVEPLLKSKSSELRVVCPFITAAYARLLVGESARKEVSVITSNSEITAAGLKILRKGRRGSVFIKIAIYLLILEVIFFLFKLYLLELAVLPFIVICVMLAAMIHSAAKKRRLRVRVSEEHFIHEKIYITDSCAITGSANLTYAGLHKNVEHLEMTYSTEKIGELRTHFWKLWKSIPE